MILAEYKKYDIPDKPGVYFWKKDELVLYIGKATHLKNRTGSYLQKNLMDRRGPLIAKMIEEADSLEFRETESVLEALLLETHLIKKHQPPYNSKEKDNSSHNYVVISNETPQRVYTVRGRALQNMEHKNMIAESFGPFPQGQLLREAMRIIKKIFPYFGRDQKKTYAQEFYKQMGQTPGVDADFNSKLYKENIRYISLLFSGKKASIIRSLKKRMKEYAQIQAFEQAARIRNQIYALEHIRDIALMKHDFETSYYQQSIRIEAYDIAHIQGDAMVGAMVVHNGIDFEKENYRLFTVQTRDYADDPAALREVFSRRLKHREWTQPDIIVVDGGMIQKRVMESVLREYDISIPVVSVVKDEKHKAKGILGRKKIIEKYQKEILAINLESHRFVLQAHKRKRRKDFLS